MRCARGQAPWSGRGGDKTAFSTDIFREDFLAAEDLQKLGNEHDRVQLIALLLQIGSAALRGGVQLRTYRGWA